MYNRLVSLIESEDKKNPLTDNELADTIGIKRDQVTYMRKKLNIVDSRERRKPYLLEAVSEIVSRNTSISPRKLALMLNQQGFSVSKYLVSQLLEEIFNGEMFINNGKPKCPYIEGMKSIGDSQSFNTIIGSQGSIKLQIQQAQAAVLYPPSGLHTLIVGPPGSGKSSLAEAMYNFGKETGVFDSKAPFITFNCADYANNPSLLLSQLFGHAKGAFTGADKDKTGLVEKADKGILLLDEIHRLPPEGQELLFYLIDKGKFSRMGETDKEIAVEILIIAATTENIESSLLLTFRRRIPMVIDVPPLASRPLTERYALIKSAFEEEASRVGVDIKVSQSVIQVLFRYKCPGNIGQLRSDIQVACAKAFLSYVAEQQDYIHVTEHDLPNHVTKSLLDTEQIEPGLDRFIRDDLYIKRKQAERKTNFKNSFHTLSLEIYSYIEREYEKLKNEGLTPKEINTTINKELDSRFNELIKHVEEAPQHDLMELVGSEVLQLTEDVVMIAESRLGRISDTVFYGLCLHLSAALDRIRTNRQIINPHLSQILIDNKEEYKVALEMAKHVEKATRLAIPDDEVGFIAMYLKTLSKSHPKEKGRVGVLVLTHGSVAKGMVSVANKLLGINHAVGVEMSLDESPDLALQRTIDVSQNIDEGRGILLLADMGSLLTFGEKVTQRTGITTMTIGCVDTVMVMEAVRRATLLNYDLEAIVKSLGKAPVFPNLQRGTLIDSSRKIIVALCITGKGAALRIKELLERSAPEITEHAEIVPLGMFDEEDICETIRGMQRDSSVIAIIGNINPDIHDIPFFSVEDIVSGDVEDNLKKITQQMGSKTPLACKHEFDLSDVLPENLILINPNITNKADLLEALASRLVDYGFVKENFLLSVLKREMWSTTVKDGIAYPHGDPASVIKPGIAIAICNQPIQWTENLRVSIIVLLALRTDSSYVLESFLQTVDNICHKALGQCKNPQEVIHLMGMKS